ncbi:MAG: septum formation initiator family protein [Coriobacteriia bacterium]|nr:septum formation initiator family protein [Coriobacteriia bacterium]
MAEKPTKEEKARKAAEKKALAKQRRSPLHYRLFKGAIVTLGLTFCCVFAFMTLYPVLREFYIASREYEILALEYAALLDRNEKIEEQIANLQTPEGVADRAREQFGWVKEGEQAINITGLGARDSTTALPGAVVSGSITTESTWWTDFLDWVFEYEATPPSQELYDPLIH